MVLYSLATSLIATVADTYTVGMYVLTEDEYHQMDLETAELVDKPGQYLVTIEMFHQLHCLVGLSRNLKRVP